MKKIALILIGALLTLASYSQDYNRIIRASTLEYRNEKWVEIESQQPKDAFIILKDWDITIGTYKLKTYDDPEKTVYEDHVCYTWKAVNPQGGTCFFLMKKFNPNITRHMIYALVYIEQGIMYEYETE